jgi:hypothetical protein
MINERTKKIERAMETESTKQAERADLWESTIE